MGALGTKNIQWTLLLTGFIVGIPLFYNVGFLLVLPLIFSVVYQYRLPAVWVGLPMLAGLTAAGVMLPTLAHSPADPNLLVLAIGAGSLLFSHVNDGGFWLFKEYFNLSVRDTLRSWSVMKTIVSVVGLAGVLLLDWALPLLGLR